MSASQFESRATVRKTKARECEGRQSRNGYDESELGGRDRGESSKEAGLRGTNGPSPPRAGRGNERERFDQIPERLPESARQRERERKRRRV